jgi:hypothetical protein
VLVIVGARATPPGSTATSRPGSAYATDLARGVALPCEDYPAEQAPDETYAELRGFFA